MDMRNLLLAIVLLITVTIRHALADGEGQAARGARIKAVNFVTGTIKASGPHQGMRYLKVTRHYLDETGLWRYTVTGMSSQIKKVIECADSGDVQLTASPRHSSRYAEGAEGYYLFTAGQIKVDFSLYCTWKGGTYRDLPTLTDENCAHE